MQINKLDKFLKIIRSKKHIKNLLQYGVVTGVEHENLLGHIKYTDFLTIVDIGANRGQFALAARRHFPKSQIYSFEPLHEPTEIFRRVFANDPLTTLYEFAIGNSEGEEVIHVSRADDSSSLLPMTALQTKLYPGTQEIEKQSVRVKPLGAVLSTEQINRPALLKIDVQGYEKQVLEGCQPLLPLFSYIYVECSFLELYAGQALAHEIIGYLAATGYVLNGIYNLDRDRNGLAVQGDFLFAQKKQ